VRFYIPEVMKKGEITAVYSMHDRMITLGEVPTGSSLELPTFDILEGCFLHRKKRIRYH
jgi:5-keto 4-deoxyuronate isomerase